MYNYNMQDLCMHRIHVNLFKPSRMGTVSARSITLIVRRWRELSGRIAGSERVSISANATAQGELLSRVGVLNVKWTLVTF